MITQLTLSEVSNSETVLITNEDAPYGRARFLPCTDQNEPAIFFVVGETITPVRISDSYEVIITARSVEAIFGLALIPPIRNMIGIVVVRNPAEQPRAASCRPAFISRHMIAKRALAGHRCLRPTAIIEALDLD